MFNLFGKPKENLDAIELLMDDHARVRELFKAFKETEDKEDPALVGLVTTACLELMVHSKLEEEIFYPAIRQAAKGDLKDLLSEAEVEHETIDSLVENLLGAPLEDEMFLAHFHVVMEYVEHHVQEEEDEMFPKVRALSLNLDRLGEQMRLRQEELVEEIASNQEIATGTVLQQGKAGGIPASR